MIRNSNRSGYVITRTKVDRKRTVVTDRRSGKITMGESATERTEVNIRRERIVASRDGLKVVETDR